MLGRMRGRPQVDGVKTFLALLLLALAAAAAWLYDPDRPRAALESTYAGPPSRFIEVLGVRLHVRDTGPPGAPALLMLHGFGASLHTWEALAPRLEPRFRVIRLDLPGFGLTGTDPADDYTDDRVIAVLATLLDRLGVARATVLGSSMGGRIAWRFAAARPERVAKLVLLAPDGFASLGRDYETPSRVPWMMRLLPYSTPRFLLRKATAPAYADPAMLTDALVDRYRDLLLAPGVRRAILHRIEQAVLPRPEPILATIRMPVLLVWGERDRAIPVGHAADYQRNLPQAKLLVMPGVGHVPMEEAPQPLAEALERFLDG